MSLQIKYKGPAPDGSRASFIGDPKEIMGTIGIPLSTRLKLIKQNGFDLYAAQVTMKTGQQRQMKSNLTSNAPWLEKNALDVERIDASAISKDVTSEDLLEFLGTFKQQVQDIVPQDIELPVISPIPHPEFSFIKVKKSLSDDALDVLKTESAKINVDEQPSRKRFRGDSLVADEVEGSRSHNVKKEAIVEEGAAKISRVSKHPSKEKTERLNSENGSSGKKTFPLTTDNGKNVSSNMWAEIGTKLKHKADDNRKDKEKRVTTYTNAIFYTASLLAFWTWCNHQEHQKHYEKVKAMAKFALDSITHHKLDLLHCYLNYSEAHIVSKIVQGLHKELQTTLSIAVSLLKDNDKDQVTSLQDIIAKSQKLQSDIWKKTILHSALLKEAYKLSPKSVNPFYEFATSTDAFAYIRQSLIDLAEEEDISISFAAIPRSSTSKTSSAVSSAPPSDIRF